MAKQISLNKISGLICFALSTSVIIGWLTKNISLIQINESFAPMQFNTALCFLLSGFGLFFLKKRNSKICLFSGIFVFMVGILTLAEYIFGINIGLDELFMKHDIVTKTSHPGRMAPNTALCFMVTGIILIINSLLKSYQYKAFILKLLSSTVLVLGLVALAGYLSGVESSYGWSNLTRMAVHTALGFVLIGFTLIKSQAFAKSEKSEEYGAIWLATSVSFLFLILSIIVWSETSSNESEFIKKSLVDEANLIRNSIEENVNSSVLALRRMSDRWQTRRGTPENEWLKDAKNYVNDNPALNTVEWVDGDYIVRWLYPLEGNEKAVGLNIKYDEERERILSAVGRNVFITPPIKLVQGYDAFITYAPIYIDDKLDGFIVGIYEIDSFIKNILKEDFVENFTLTIKDKDKEAFKIRGGNRNIYLKQYLTQTEANLFNRVWSISLIPSNKYIESKKTSLPEALLFGMVTLSVLIGIAIYYAMKAHRKNKLLSVSNLDLMESREQFKNAMHYSCIGMALVSPEGKWLKVNKAIEKILGYEEQELKLIDFQKITHPDDLEGDLKLVKNLLDGKIESYEIEKRYFHKKGKLVWSLLSVSLVKNQDGTAKHFISQIQDITERKEAENKLKESEKLLNATFNTVSDAIVTIDEKGIIRSINSALVNMSGYMEKELIGHSIKTIMPEKYHNAHESGISRYLKTKEKKVIGKKNVELESIRKDGNIFPIEIGIGEVNLEGESFFVGIMRDITERKNDEINRQKLVEELTQSNEELEKFAYICSHDLQEPMRMVRSFSERLETHLIEKIKLDEKTKLYLKFITDGAERAQLLISDILSYSRIDNSTSRIEQFDLNDVIEAVKHNSYLSFEESKGRLNFDKMPIIRGNKTQVFQLIQNLVNNGLKYQNGREEPSIHISCEDVGDFYKISVKDNGIGIEEKHLDNIFEVFKRLHGKHEYSGTGIGLSICKKIVEKHEGKITVESEVGKGSTFIFTIMK